MPCHSLIPLERFDRCIEGADPTLPAALSAWHFFD